MPLGKVMPDGTIVVQHAHPIPKHPWSSKERKDDHKEGPGRCKLSTGHMVRVPQYDAVQAATVHIQVEAPCALFHNHMFKCIPESSLDVRRRFKKV